MDCEPTLVMGWELTLVMGREPSLVMGREPAWPWVDWSSTSLRCKPGVGGIWPKAFEYTLLKVKGVRVLEPRIGWQLQVLKAWKKQVAGNYGFWRHGTPKRGRGGLQRGGMGSGWVKWEGGKREGRAESGPAELAKLARFEFC